MTAPIVLDVHTLGAGFRLTKAWHVTRALGGRLWIDSELGHGATVTLEVPRPDLRVGAVPDGA